MNSLWSKDWATARAVARAGVGAYDTAGVGVGGPLPSIRATPTSLYLPMGGAFQQRV